MKYLYSHHYNPNRDKQSLDNMYCICSAFVRLITFYGAFTSASELLSVTLLQHHYHTDISVCKMSVISNLGGSLARI